VVTPDDMNSRNEPLTDGQKFNIEDMCIILNELERHAEREITLTNGFRSEAHHRAIYKAKGISNPPMGSAHLRGLAADISDPDGFWCDWFFKSRETGELTKQGEEFLKDNGCHLEHPHWTPNWIHIQGCPPRSGKLVFIP